MWDVVEKLGPWPILQFGLVTLIVIISVVTYMRVLASKFPTTASGQQPSQHAQGSTQEVSFLYFQGWFKGVLEDLQTLKTNQEVNRMQTREMVTDELRKARHDFRNALAEVQAEIKMDIEATRHEHQVALNNVVSASNNIVEAMHELRNRLVQTQSRK